MKLSESKRGQRVRIQDIGVAPCYHLRIQELGLRPGAEATVVQQSRLIGAVLGLGGARVAINRASTRHIEVEQIVNHSTGISEGVTQQNAAPSPSLVAATAQG
ncbi:MAG: FeoA family protein [Actinomycetaceae bacterium]|nr:FeoA family protein [Actinomycetaceae bacterium]